MKRKRDFSMLYGALAGFILLVGGFILLALINDALLPWYECSDFERLFTFPEGTPYHLKNTHGGFLGDGVTVLTAQIPLESSQDFVQVLWEKGFTDSPVPEDIRKEISNDPDTNMVPEVSNCLWWFQDESPDKSRDWYTNYTFHMYDLDTCTYYYIEYDT